MKIVSNQIAPDTGTSSALWNTLYGSKQEIYATVKAFPGTSHSFELWMNVQAGDTATPSGYCLRFWHHSGGGVGALELDRVDAGVLTRLTDQGKTLSINDELGLQDDAGTLRVFVNGVEEFNASDKTYALVGQVGVATLNDSGLLSRLSDIGGGGVPVVRPQQPVLAGRW